MLRLRISLPLLALVALVALPAFAQPAVIAHRGASGYLPEHTLPAFAMAYEMGADYLEPDLVRTKDGHFVALHDLQLETVTDVAEVFPDRARDDDRWYVADFTLSELRQLSVSERFPRRFPQGKSRFQIVTFEELIEFTQGLNAVTGRNVGLYPELKDPRFHAREGLEMEEDFLKIIRAYGYDAPDANIFIQSFSEGPLKRLRELGCQAPIVFLANFSTAQTFDAERLAEIASYANGIGPEKRAIEADPDLVARAHAAGLVVHPYTLRSDVLPAKYETAEAEIAEFFGTYRVDGMFTDHPADAVAWINANRHLFEEAPAESEE